MPSSNSSKKFLIGVVSAIICLLAVSTHPVIIKSRDSAIDSLFYALITVLSETILVIPILIYETKKRNSLKSAQSNNESTQIDNQEIRKFSKKEIIFRFLIIGSVFAIAQIGINLGLETADATTGSIALKSSIIFTIIFGLIFLKEKVSMVQIILTFVLFGALYYTLSEGTFQPLNIELGAIILTAVPLLWTIGHTTTKPMLKHGAVFPTQVIFIRMMISSSILFVMYFIVLENPLSKFALLANIPSLINAFLIGGAYLTGHYFWYTSIKNVDMAVSSAIQAPQPIVTTILATIFLNESMGIYHLIGMIIIVVSILLILRDKKNIQKKEEEKCIPSDNAAI